MSLNNKQYRINILYGKKRKNCQNSEKKTNFKNLQRKKEKENGLQSYREKRLIIKK